jgi:hypothetical protein
MELIQEEPTPEEWADVLGALNLPPKYPFMDAPGSPNIPAEDSVEGEDE